jgi:ABC-2 type transport system ATP-binding protein
VLAGPKANIDTAEPAKTTTPILRTSSLSKRYGSILAVKSLDLEILPGQVLGLLGPNGSGKTTTISMILDLVRPTAGTVQLFGLPLAQHRWACLRRIGAIIETPAFYPYLSGRDNLRLMARAVGDVPESAVDDAIDRVGLTERAKSAYKTYSLGMKQRLGIAFTLLRQPDFVILDEPTNGLDPAGTREVRELIIALAREGRTVLLASHLLHEVQHVCSHVAILKRGELLAQGAVEEMLRGDGSLLLRADDMATVRQALEQVEWLGAVEESNGYLRVRAPVDAAARVNALLAERGIFLSELRPEESTLEQYFLEVTEESDE